MRTPTPRTPLAALAGMVLVVTGCTGEPDTGPDTGPGGGSQAGSSSAQPTPRGTGPTSPSPTPTEPEEPALPPVDSPVSLPAVMREEARGELDGSRLRQVEVIEETDAYTRAIVTYESRDLTVSGVLLRPRGRGPFPGVVLNHGYIEPSVYAPGQGMAREQDYLARAGYAVLHTDYRGHASGDPASDLDRESRLGYARDAVTAVRSLAREPYVDADRLGMVGRSMGGGVTLSALVVAPDLVDAAVVHASVSSDYVDNLEQFTEPGRPEQARELYDELGGPPSGNPEPYRQLSPRTYFDRVSDPVLAIHGDVDDTCPPPWADATQRALVRAGADAQLETYPGEGHTFYAGWQSMIERTDEFLTTRMGAA
ncbi:S9 family peptidase [Nocardioides sp. CFH 31398]|uniref:alpha/beta hydrolase family protein n=1 Tax=Nocardioides sp. CFH 31398 TaxID=2919579 RepID=UPI001F067B01|nr:alpha/beta fold hydrolase [Nocardioides sp. CFH 31398]MCH1867691.1 alpha/beta fold hydrolase [Nocardioides sp. CFH 31398]